MGLALWYFVVCWVSFSPYKPIFEGKLMKATLFCLALNLTAITAYANTCVEIYHTNPQSAISICQQELTQSPNNVELQFYLGYAYKEIQDYQKAFEWFTKSADLGEIHAQNNLGMMYRDGKGVIQDYAKAYELFTKSANQGLDTAEYNLGVMYYFGMGIKQDETRAFEWYTKSANQGFAKAQFALGMMYYLKQDYASALEWFGKSAEQEHPHAQTHLGMMYNNGYGVPRNSDTAKYWFAKACENGYDLSCYHL